LPLVFDSPHSGRIYPDDFDYACEFEDLEKAEDNYVDDLFLPAPEHGGTLLCALFPRTYIDPNRAQDDFDPELLDGELPYPITASPRARAGVGLIRRIIKPDTPIYSRKLNFHEVGQRIEKYYKPYHIALEKLLDDSYNKFGSVWHINCHSMPSKNAISKYARDVYPDAPDKLPDFIIGDRDGTSCDPEFSNAIQGFLKDLGYKVTINNPYKGVELVRRYSNPDAGRHSVQIEINKALYWDEDSAKKSKKYNGLKIDAEKLIEFCAGYAQNKLGNIDATP